MHTHNLRSVPSKCCWFVWSNTTPGLDARSLSTQFRTPGPRVSVRSYSFLSEISFITSDLGSYDMSLTPSYKYKIPLEMKLWL